MEKNARNVQLGTATLENVLSGPVEPKQGRIHEVDGLLRSLDAPEGSRELRPYERVPLRALCAERASYMYPSIDVGFLRGYDALSQKGYEIQVPRFGVFPYYGKTNTFGLMFEITNNGEFLARPWVNIAVYPKLDGLLDQAFLEGLDIPSELRFVSEDEIFLRGDIEVQRESHLYRTIDLPKGEIRGLCKKWGIDVNTRLWVNTSFNGIVPEDVQEEVAKRARTVFREGDIYIVTEKKPEEWSTRRQPTPRLTVDPLIIGVANDQAFLIDHFDTTPVEEHVRREWTNP